MRRIPVRYRNFVLPIIGILLIFWMTRVAINFLYHLFPPATPTGIATLTGMPSTPGAEFLVNQEIHYSCGEDAAVIDASIVLGVSGGKLPYHAEFDPGETALDNQGTGFRFTLPGGSSVKVTIYDSQEEKRNEKKLEFYIPTHHSECEGQTPVITNTAILTDTSTPTVTPTNTPHHTNTPTYTPREGDPVTPTSTPTPTYTDTPSTPTHTPTNTPTSTPTNTPTKTPTNTPTNTPTYTPTPAPTSTSTPTPTDTPKKTPAQCEDEIDNDDDLLVDKDDPGCQNKNDNDESG